MMNWVNPKRSRRAVVAVSVSVAAIVVLAAVGAVAVAGVLDDDSDAAGPGVALRVPTKQVPGSAGILERCASAEDDRDEDLGAEPRLFGPHAEVLTADSNDGGTAAFILGNHRQYYAECNLSADGSDDWIHEYDVGAAPGGGQNTLYMGRHTFTYFDRFPADVARVRLSLYGGGVVEAPAVQGFVVFANSAGSPDRVSLLDESGEVLAEAAWADLPASYDSLLPSARR